MSESKEDVLQFQQTQQQMQMLVMQKQNIQMQSLEVENALKEIDRVKEDSVFEIVGNVMIKKSKEEVEKALKEKKELVDLRTSTLEKQIEKLNEKAVELQKKMYDKLKEKKKE